MKLSKIETKYEENDYGFPLYDAEQMREYAKECVIDALKEYVGPYSDKKANSIISRIVK